MDIATKTDIQELKAVMADEFVKREQAIELQQQCQANIMVIAERLKQLQNDKDMQAVHDALEKKAAKKKAE